LDFDKDLDWTVAGRGFGSRDSQCERFGESPK
jgi:hypothetical protein